MYFIYILECSDGTLYTGSTNDLEKRIHAHNHLKSGAHYTKIRRPVILKYSESCNTYTQARNREREIKQLTRKEKFDIIKRINNPINLKTMAKGNNSQKKDVKKPKKNKK